VAVNDYQLLLLLCALLKDHQQTMNKTLFMQASVDCCQR